MAPLSPTTAEARRGARGAEDRWPSPTVAEGRGDLPPSRDAPRLARRSIQHTAGATMDHFERELVDVLMSELVTDAVVHPPRRCGGNVILRFALSQECIRVEVHDAGEGFSMTEVGKHRSEPGGYGLLMVERG